MVVVSCVSRAEVGVGLIPGGPRVSLTTDGVQSKKQDNPIYKVIDLYVHL